jgi:hypothetical protein
MGVNETVAYSLGAFGPMATSMWVVVPSAEVLYGWPAETLPAGSVIEDVGTFPKPLPVIVKVKLVFADQTEGERLPMSAGGSATVKSMSFEIPPSVLMSMRPSAPSVP